MNNLVPFHSVPSRCNRVKTLPDTLQIQRMTTLQTERRSIAIDELLLAPLSPLGLIAPCAPPLPVPPTENWNSMACSARFPQGGGGGSPGRGKLRLVFRVFENSGVLVLARGVSACGASVGAWVRQLGRFAEDVGRRMDVSTNCCAQHLNFTCVFLW